jgi:hypothetical protein
MGVVSGLGRRPMEPRVPVGNRKRKWKSTSTGHLDRISEDDARSRAIIAQMRDDENRHGETGRTLGRRGAALRPSSARWVCSRA